MSVEHSEPAPETKMPMGRPVEEPKPSLSFVPEKNPTGTLTTDTRKFFLSEEAIKDLPQEH